MKWITSENATTDTELQTSLMVVQPVDADSFPNIAHIMKITCTQLNTTVECEHSISTLHFLKTYLHSTMGEAWLNGLVILLVRCGILCNTEFVVDDFAHRHPRRLQLLNSLCVDGND